jgi:hypothetical protein
MKGESGESPSIPIPRRQRAGIFTRHRDAKKQKRTGRIVSTVFKPGETIAEDLADVRAVLFNKVGAVGKDT